MVLFMLELDIINLDCSVVGKIKCHKKVFCHEYKEHIVAQVAKWQLAKKRSGSSNTRGISDISGTTAKPYKQKGTGRARQGSLRSPQFVGGATIFGPKPRDHGYKINKKIRAQALKSLLSYKLSINKISILESANLEQRRTKYLLSLPAFAEQNSVLIIDESIDKNMYLACKNIFKFDILPCEGMNVYDLMIHDKIFLTKASLPIIEKRLVK